MKPNVHALAASDPRKGLFHSKLFIVALILALLLAALPAASALAAPAKDQGTIREKDLELGWKNKLNHLRWAGFYYDHVQFYPADFERPADLARIHELLEKYGIALRAANTVLLNHAGFDIEGNVLNEVQADQSVRELAAQLQIMRGLREKIKEVPGGK